MVPAWSRLLAGLVGAMVAPVGLAADPEPDAPPVAVFAELDGTWSGEFVGYDPTGKELYRIEVEQTYETIDATRQRVRIRDRMADGTVITGAGENRAERLADGTLALTCVVDKSNGDRVSHQGRVVQLPGGAPALVWSSAAPDRTETFLEQVEQIDGTWVYDIQGTGRYGETVMVMRGRYTRQGAGP